jgi:peptide/nickel transport system substrate-binding protein
VDIKTKGQYSFLPWDMSHFMVPSPTAVKTYGVQDYIKHATGTGPYKMTKYVDGQVMELEPNADYWKGKPKLDKIVLRPMPDPAPVTMQTLPASRVVKLERCRSPGRGRARSR